ncbi:MAG: 4Fe-4S binding protein [Magnetococcales bacterium]|nr:4Fe-4S binding protein [Magnetococcales bacterium]
MALSITESCVGCWACVDVCPNQAIEVFRTIFRIVPELCQECEFEFPDSQCAEICPVEEAILDGAGRPVNPLGSLTGVPPSVRRAFEGRSAPVASDCR